MQLSAQSDLSTAMQLRRDNNDLKVALGLAAREMATGKVASISGATGGYLQEILALDRTIGLSETYQVAISLAQARAQAAQLSMSVLADMAGELAPDLLASAGRGDDTTRVVLAASSKSAFGAAVVALNTRYADRNLFGGAAADGPAVDSAAAILAEVSVIVGAQPDAASAAAAVAFYFNDPAGGFQTGRYLGSPQPGPQLRISDREVAASLPSVVEPGVLALLEGLALAAVVADGAFTPSPAEQIGLMDAAGRRLLSAEDQLQTLRNDIGRSEARLAEVQETTGAESAALKMVRNSIVGVDQFDAATRFEALRGQLETSYLTTARLSQLTLAAFLR